MLTIQELGLSIMGDTPKSFYILGGTEFGIKEKYIDILESKIGTRIEHSSVIDLIASMEKKHLIPIPPSVYVIRYDKTFLSKLSEKNSDIATRVKNCKINGCIVFIYETDADVTKCDKYFPENTSIVTHIDTKFVIKYLKSDFPELKDEYCQIAAKVASDYYQAKNIARCLYSIQDKCTLTEGQVKYLFGLDTTYKDSDLMLAIANRDFASLVYMSEHFEGDIQNIFYTILRTMIELDKCLDNKYTQSPLQKASKLWTRYDVYYYFNHTYNALKQLRLGYAADPSLYIVYLAALLRFKQIPDMKVLGGC
jgi:hypothetical protein